MPQASHAGWENAGKAALSPIGVAATEAISIAAAS
jgi:hypothetical protein